MGLKKSHMEKDRRIVVLQAGWVFVGDYEETERGVRLSDASVIRTWGTSKGLGQLALQGKTKDTVLDPCGVFEAPMSAVICTLSVVNRGV